MGLIIDRLDENFELLIEVVTDVPAE